MRKFIIPTLLIAILLVGVGCSTKESSDGGYVFDYGAHTYTDPKIMGHIVKALVEDQTIHEVKITENIQASPQIINALDKGDIEMATLFSGEIYNDHFEDVEFSKDPETMVSMSKDLFDEHFDFKYYDPVGFRNMYGIAVTNDFYEENGVENMSDLAPFADDLRAGTDTTWMERGENDGYKGFKESYGYEFGDISGMEISLMYQGIENGDLDVITAYTVDAEILEYNLKLVEDDKGFFPPIQPSLVVRNDILEEYPELGEILDMTEGLIETEEEMTELMYEVDIEGRDIQEVAEDFLVERGLLEK